MRMKDSSKVEVVYDAKSISVKFAWSPWDTIVTGFHMIFWGFRDLCRRRNSGFYHILAGDSVEVKIFNEEEKVA